MLSLIQNKNVSLNEAKHLYHTVCPNTIEDENVYLSLIQIAIQKNNIDNVRTMLLAREDCYEGESIPMNLFPILYYTISNGSLETLQFVMKNMFLSVAKNESFKIPVIDMLYHLEKHNDRGWWSTSDDCDRIKEFLTKYKNCYYGLSLFEREGVRSDKHSLIGFFSDSNLTSVIYAFSTTVFETDDEFKRGLVRMFHGKLSKETLKRLIFH